jgi:hypothetical protein
MLSQSMSLTGVPAATTVALAAPWNDSLHDPPGRDHAWGYAVIPKGLIR